MAIEKPHARFCCGSSLWFDRSQACKRRDQGCFGGLDNNSLDCLEQPWWDAEMKQWIWPSWDAESASSWSQITLKNEFNRAVEKFGIDYVLLGLEALHIWDWPCHEGIPLWENEVGHGWGPTHDGYTSCSPAGIRSILVKPVVQHDSIKTQSKPSSWAPCHEKSLKKYGPITYKKESNYGRNSPVLAVEQPFRRQTRLIVVLPQSALKRFGDWRSLLPTLFPSPSYPNEITDVQLTDDFIKLLHEVGDSDALVVNVIDILWL